METPWFMSLLAHATIGVSSVSCSVEETDSESHNDEHAVHWGYEADNGPDAWGSMNSEWALCTEGREQSPIDLTGATMIELPAVDIHTPSEQEVEVLNQAGASAQRAYGIPGREPDRDHSLRQRDI